MSTQLWTIQKMDSNSPSESEVVHASHSPLSPIDPTWVEDLCKETTIPLPVSPEYDRLREFFLKDGVDRSDWYERVLSEAPELQDFIERIDPITRAATFARHFLPSGRLIDQETLLALISQCLRTLGLLNSQNCLHEEWPELRDVPTRDLVSHLSMLIQRGVSRAEKFWELSLPTPAAPSDIEKQMDQEISKTVGGVVQFTADETPHPSEEPGDPQFLRMDDEWKPCEASLNQIIWWLTGEEDVQLMRKAVCLTYKSFTTSRVFLSKIKERYECASNETDQDQRANSLKQIMKLFETWVQDAGDIIEPEVMEDAKHFVDSHAEIRRFVSTKFEKRAQRCKVDYEKAPPVELGTCRNWWCDDFDLMDLPAKEVARQFTVFSSQKYYAIGKIELLDSAWKTDRLKFRAPNVVALINHRESVCEWVKTVLLKAQSKDLRLKTLSFLVDVMMELQELRNYWDLVSFFDGFYDPDVWNHREDFGFLELTPVQQQFVDHVEELQKPGNNYKLMREAQDKAWAERKPCVPYLTVLLMDLSNVSENAQTFVNGLVNLRKCRNMVQRLEAVEKFQRERYCLLPIDQALAKIEALDVDKDVLD